MEHPGTPRSRPLGRKTAHGADAARASPTRRLAAAAAVCAWARRSPGPFLLPDNFVVDALEAARAIAAAVRENGGRALIVGGWVRDRLRGRPSKDLDVEVFGIPE